MGDLRLRLPLVACLVAAVLLAGCGESDRARLARELTDQLTAAGYAVSDVEVWPPRGTVPHWNVDLAVSGDLAEAERTCKGVEGIAAYDGQPPYLIRVVSPQGEAQCGTSRASPSGPSAGPGGSAVSPSPSTSPSAVAPSPTSPPGPASP